MAFDSLHDVLSGQSADVTPAGIAHNALFTAKEKIELLNQLKSEVTGARQEGSEPGFDAAEIDRAIAEVRQAVQDGIGADTVLKGDF